MNNQQTLFVILYGIYFATTISTSGRFHPFDSSAVVARDKRAIWRFLIGFLFINLIPLFYLLWALSVLKPACGSLEDSICISVAVLFASLGGFGLYRIFCSLMILRRRSMLFVFYSAPEEVREQLRPYTNCRKPPPEAQLVPFRYLFVGGVVWILVSLLALLAIKWLLLPNQ